MNFEGEFLDSLLEFVRSAGEAFQTG